jgi:hypothetical protein
MDSEVLCANPQIIDVTVSSEQAATAGEWFPHSLGQKRSVIGTLAQREPLAGYHSARKCHLGPVGLDRCRLTARFRMNERSPIAR